MAKLVLGTGGAARASRALAATFGRIGLMAVAFVAMATAPPEASAQACQRFVATTGADGTNTCQSSGTPCDTISHAIAQAASGDVVCIAGGVYPEQPLVDKPLTLLGQGAPITAGDAPGYTSITYTGAAPNQDIVRIEAPGVVLRNLNVRADLSFVRRAIHAGSIADGLLIEDVRVASFQSGPSLASRRGAITLNFPRDGTDALENATVRDSFIVRELASSTYFQDGIRGELLAGVEVRGNVVNVSTQGIHAKFSHGNLTVVDNRIGGGGVELGEHNAGVAAVTVEGNVFEAVEPNFAGTALRLQQNNPTGGVHPATVVRGNSFGTATIGHVTGVWLQNYPQVTIEANTFVPISVAGVSSHGMIVSSKVVSSTSADPALAPMPFDGIVVAGNRFRGCGAGTCTAVRFAHHRTEGAAPSMFGSIVVGGAGPAANAFAASLTDALVLDEQAGASNGSTVAPFQGSYGGSIGVTTMAPFAGDVQAPRNLVGVTAFDGSGNPLDGIDTTTMSVAGLVALNQMQVEDRRDDALPKARGAVRFGAPNVAYAGAGPTSLPVGTGVFAAGDCTGTENQTGCGTLDLSNLAPSTAVAEHVEVAIALSRSGGPGGALAPTAVVLQYETSPGTFTDVALSGSGTLEGALPVPPSPSTAPPYALEAGNGDVLDRVRMRFLEGGDYTLTSVARGKETLNPYAAPVVHAIGVVAPGLLAFDDDPALGAGAARVTVPETYPLALDNSTGGTSESLSLRVVVRGQGALAPAALDLVSSFGPVALVAQPDGSLAGSVPIGPALGNASLTGDLVATYAVPDTYRIDLAIVSAAGSPIRTYATASRTVAAGTPLGAGTAFDVRSIGATSSVPDAGDNDYTRIARVLAILQSGDTMFLQGDFHWTEASAKASWALGADGTAATEDDWQLTSPFRPAVGELSNVRIDGLAASDAIPSPAPRARVFAGGDLPDDANETFLFLRAHANGGHPTIKNYRHQNWTIRDLELLDFDQGIITTWAHPLGIDISAQQFDGLLVENVHFRVPSDRNNADEPVPTAVDFSSRPAARGNIAIQVGYGLGQRLRANTIEIALNPASTFAGGASHRGIMTLATSVAGYSGLEITDTIITVSGGEAAAPDAPSVIGVWENDFAWGTSRGLDVTYARNVYANLTASAAAPATNRQIGFRFTSLSRGADVVRFERNEVSGASIGIQARLDPGAAAPIPAVMTAVELEGNALFDNGIGFHVAPYAAGDGADRYTLAFNRIVGNATGAVNEGEGQVDAEDNWWGCNGGPGAQPAQCAAAANGTAGPGALDADPWLVMELAADSPTIDLAMTTPLSVSFNTNSDGTTAAAPTLFPDGTAVAFTSAPAADSVPTDADGTLGGIADDATFDPATSGLHLVGATTDGQTVYDSVLVTAGGSVTIVPCNVMTSCTPTAFDNDYTRINDAVQLIGSNGTIVLDGMFDWRWGPGPQPAPAYVSWSLGSNGVDDAVDFDPNDPSAGDDFTISAPAGRSDVTITGANAATVVRGPVADDPAVPYESFLVMHQGLSSASPAPYANWTISNFRVMGFDQGLFMRNLAGRGFEGTRVTGMRFVVPADAPDATEVVAAGYEGFVFNRGVLAGPGVASVDDNEFELAGGGVDGAYVAGPFGTYYSGSRSSGIELQNSTSAQFDGIAITGNDVTATGATGGETTGIWDNAGDCAAALTISDNAFTATTGTAGRTGIRLWSYASTGKPIVVERNRVSGAEHGLLWPREIQRFCPGPVQEAVTLRSNVLVENDNGVSIDDSADDAVQAVLALNRIALNGTGVRNAQSSGATILADDNWWGCNEGPASAASNGCNPNAGAIDADRWITVAATADAAAIASGGSTGVHGVLRANAAPFAIADVASFPASEPVFFDASFGSVLPANATFHATVAGSADAVFSTSPADQGGALVVAAFDNEFASTLVRVGGTTLTIESCTSEPGCVATPLDNDYTRINNAVQVLQPGDTLELAGTFDWSFGPAYDSWSLGSDGADDAPGSIEDFSIDVPAGLTDLTVRGLGGATIRGGGDLASRPDELFENFLMFWDRNDPATPADTTTWSNLEISGLTIEGFDVGLFLVTTAGEGTFGIDDFDGLHLHGNTVRVAADLMAENDGGAGVGNYGIYQGWGSGQVTELNAFEFDAGGGPDSGSVGLLVGGNCNVACYDGLVVRDNTFELASVGPGYVRALFENGADTGSDMTIERNTIDFGGGAGDFGGIHVESFSNTGPTPATVLVRDNTVSGGNSFGIRVSAVGLGAIPGEAGVRVEGNTILGGDNAVFVADRYGRVPPAPAIHYNRLVGQATALAHNIPALAIDATNNWFGCNAGPGTPASPACTTGTGAIGSPDIDADPWLVLALEPGASVVPRTGQTSLDANLSRNSATQDVSGASVFPAAPVSFAITAGGPATLDDALVPTGTGLPVPHGVAPNALRQLLATTTASATLDGQTVAATVQVEAVTLDLGTPAAALTGVETTPFTVRARNDGAPIAEPVSAYFAVSHAMPLVPTDVELYDDDGDLVLFGDANNDGVLEGSIPLGPLPTGEIAVDVSLRFTNAAKVGNYTFDGLIIGDASEAFYAEDTEIVRVAAESEVVVTAHSGTPQTAPVGQPYTLPLAARVTAFGLPLSGVTVGFAGPGTGASIVFGASSTNVDTGATDANGVATSSAFDANLVAGAFAANASVATCSGASCAASYSLRNTADAPASVSLAAIGCTSATVATAFCGSAAADLRATVLDANGNPVEGVSVTFAVSIAASGATASPSPGITALTSASGVAEVALDANARAGSYAAIAQVAGGGGPIASSAVALSNTADADPAQIGLRAGTGGGQTAAINTSYGLPLQATVVDRFLNPLGAGYAVTFASPAPGAGVTFADPQPLTSDANGVVQAGVVANATTGSFQVTATLAPASCTTPPANSPTCATAFTLTNVTSGAASVDLDATPLQAAVDTGSYALTADVRDAGNNPVAGVSVSFVVDYGENGAGTDANALVVVTDAAGVAPATFSANTIAGAFSIRAIVSGAPADSVALENLAGAATALVTVSGSSQSAEVNALFAQPLVVRAEDAFGNPVAGETVAFAGPGSGASASFEAPQQLVTGSDGLASTIARANGVAGAYSVNATSGALSTGFTLTNEVDADGATLALAGTPVGSVASSGPVWSSFSATTTNAGSGIAENVVVDFLVARTGGAVVGDVDVQYQSATPDCGPAGTFCSIPLADTNADGILEGRFGPVAGFPLMNVTTNLRASFTRGGEYVVDAAVVGVTSGDTYASDDLVVDVAALDLVEASALTGAVGELVHSSSSLRNTGTAGLDNGALTATPLPAPNDASVQGRVRITHSTPLAAGDVAVEYFDATTEAWLVLPLTASAGGLEGVFGPSAGFPVAAGYDATTLFRSRFLKTGDHTFATIIRGVTAAGATTGVVYDASTTVVGIDTGNAATIAIDAGSPQSTTVAQPFATALRVLVRDAGGNPVEGAQVGFAAAAAGASAAFAGANPATTDANGFASITASANTVAGTHAVVASISNGASVSFALTNLADGADAQVRLAAASGAGQTAPVNTMYAADLVVRATDRFGNALAGRTIAFAAPASGASATLAPASATTGADGLAASRPSANGLPGTFEVSTSDAGCTASPDSVCSVAFGLANTVSAPTTLALTLQPDGDADPSDDEAEVGALPGGGGAYALRATVTDGAAPVPGVSVTFLVDEGANGAGVVPTSITATTDVAGVADASFAANEIAGAFVVRAVVAGVTPDAGDATTLTNLAAAASIVTGTPDAGTTQSTPVGTAFDQALVVSVTDAFGNVRVGEAITFTIGDASGATASLSPAGPYLTDANGQVSVIATANGTAGGPYTVTASHGTAGSAVFSLENLPAGADGMTAVAGSTPQATVVDTPFGASLAVLVVDGSGNPVPDVVVNFIAPSSGASALLSGSSDTTGADGIASVDATANTVAGSYDVVASSSAGTVAFDLTNTPDPDRTMTAQPGTTPQSTPISTAFGAALAVRIVDEFGNPVAGTTVTYTVTDAANGASATLDTASDATDADGIASVAATANATAGGPYAVVASSADGDVTFSLTNLVGGAMQLVKVAGDAQTGVVPGAAVPVDPQVRLVDAGNNPVSGVAVTFAVATGGGTAAGTIVTTDLDGLAAVDAWTLGPVANAANTLTASAPGASTVTFTATSGNASNDVSVTVDNQRTTVRETQPSLYSVTITNGGTGNATGITLAAVYTGLDVASSAWVCVGSGATCPAASGTGTIAGQAFDLPPGGALTFAVQAVVTGLPDSVASLEVSAALPVNADPVLANNAAEDADLILPEGEPGEEDALFGNGFEDPVAE